MVRKSMFRPTSSGLSGHQICVPLEVERPAPIAGDTIAHTFPAIAMAFQVSVLNLDARSLWRLGGKAHLPLTDLLRFGLQLPLRADIPCQQHPIGRFIFQNACPTAFTAVDTAVIEKSTDSRFEDRLRYLNAKQIVLRRFESAEV